MDLMSDRGRRVTVEELNTTRLLAHARQQAHERKFDDMMIVDVDAHHYENEHMKDILPFMENDVLRQLSMAQTMKGGRGTLMPDTGRLSGHGRPRHPLSAALLREDRARPHRDVQLGNRWMDAMSVDYSCLFPTGMLNIGLHPQKEMEVDLCWAYNRWVTEKCCRNPTGACISMLCLPFSDPDESAAPRRDLRPSQGRRRLHGHHRAHAAGARQCLHEGLSRHRGARPRAVVPLGVQLERNRVPRLQPLHLCARARLLVLQHPPLHQLGGERHGRALPQAAGDLDRVGPRLGAVPDAAARPRIHDAAVRVPAAQEEADASTCATCTTRRSRWRSRTCAAME